MEMGLALLAVPALAWSATHIPRKIAIALAVFLLLFAAERLPPLLRFTDQATRPVDMASGIEYRIAKWIDANLPGQRVMVPGSIAQWFNVFSDTPQLSGASYSTTPNWTQHEAMKSALTSFNPQETEVAVLWLKAFGVQAATAVGRQTPEFWKGVSSTKFDGLLPVLWRGKIPPSTVSRSARPLAPSFGHSPGRPQKIRRRARRPHSPRRNALGEFAHVTIDTALTRSNHPVRRVTTADGMCQRPSRDVAVTVRFPGHRSPVRRRLRIELTYNGGWEYLLLRALSLLTILGLAGYDGLMRGRAPYLSLLSSTRLCGWYRHRFSAEFTRDSNAQSCTVATWLPSAAVPGDCRSGRHCGHGRGQHADSTGNPRDPPVNRQTQRGTRAPRSAVALRCPVRKTHRTKPAAAGYFIPLSDGRFPEGSWRSST